MTLIAIIRIRGRIKVKSEINDTMKMLNLTRQNHCVIYKDSKSLRGMLHKIKDYVTYGEINKDTLMKLLKKRLRLVGNKKVDDNILKEKKLTWDKVIDLFEKNPKELYEKGFKPVFRLTPPSKGFERKGIKLPFNLGGALGNRKEKINDLLLKMI